MPKTFQRQSLLCPGLQLLGRYISFFILFIYTFELDKVEATMAEIGSQGRLEQKVPDIEGCASETNAEPDAEAETFILGRRAILIFLTLAVLTLMAALDGTSISVALPVCNLESSEQIQSQRPIDYRAKLAWNSH